MMLLNNLTNWQTFAGIVGVHHYAGTVVNAVALMLNITLLYLILNYSTFQIRAFKNLFLLTCVGDTLLSLVVLVGQPVSKASFIRINEAFSTSCSTKDTHSSSRTVRFAAAPPLSIT